jgi:integrase
MAVRQRGNGRWQADVIVVGRRVRKDFADKVQAEAWEAATRVAMEAKRPPRPTTEFPAFSCLDRTDDLFGGCKEHVIRTLKDAMEQTYDRHYRGTKWGAKTWQTMRRVMADIGEDRPLSRINSETLATYASKMRMHNKSASTINNRLAVLSKVLQFACDCGAIDRVPRIKRESIEDARPRALSLEEEVRVLDTLRDFGKEEAAQVVAVLIDTGMRQSELFTLSPCDVDLEDGTITLPPARYGAGKILYQGTSKAEIRTIHMTQRVRKIIESRLKPSAPDGFLFPGDIYWLRHAWDRARASMGLMDDPNFVPYICRHTCAFRQFQKGIPIRVIQRWMGHKTIKITKRYAIEEI